MQKSIKKLALLAILISTNGCANVAAGTNWVQPICISKDDILTRGTKEQILTHDETLGKKCK